MSRIFVLALVAALATAACGKKGSLMPPQLVQPDSPDDLSAVVIPGGIRLSWGRPQHYSGGQRMNDLGGFVVERAAAGDVPSPFARVGELELTDQTRFRKDRRLEWFDPNVVPGEHYLYRVTAFTLDGYRSPPAGPIAIRFGPGAKESE